MRGQSRHLISRAPDIVEATGGQLPLSGGYRVDTLTGMTTETLDDLTLYCIDQVAEGRTLHDIAGELGVTHGMIWRRCTASKEAQRRYWLAREAATDLLESELIDVARVVARKDAKAARVQASVLQWIIEKRDPHRYGAQLRLAHSSPDGSMSPANAIDPTKLSKAALDELMAARNAETER